VRINDTKKSPGQPVVHLMGSFGNHVSLFTH
jgi:hypothetical protein